MIKYRTFEEADYSQIFKTMDEAFSDYQVDMKMDIDTYRNRLELEGVSFEHSVGAFDGEKLVGATMNAIGSWNGVRAVHDLGTGVIPEYRRMGISTGMFEFIVPQLKEQGFERYSLEVITDNEAAYRLYRRSGFEVTRDFVICEHRDIFERKENSADIEIRSIENPDWDQLKTFWTFEPAWQNSSDCIKRAKLLNFGLTLLGAYKNNELVGYAAAFADSGKIAQIAVSEKFRRKGFGNALLNDLASKTKKSLLMTNIDNNAIELIKVLESNGFAHTLSQYEMVLTL